jgi:hypothetical protein
MLQNTLLIIIIILLIVGLGKVRMDIQEAKDLNTQQLETLQKTLRI